MMNLMATSKSVDFHTIQNGTKSNLQLNESSFFENNRSENKTPTLVN